MNKLKQTLRKITLFFRHRKFKNKNLKNKDVTILSNCCIGGAMYNDLGLKFLSPTINLFFGHHSYLDWVNHIDEYRDAELIDTGEFDVNENGLHGPVCKLVKEGLPEIEIHFLHYNSFDEAKEKWFSRYKRINKNKIFCVIEAMAAHEHELIDEYAALPFNKIIFTDLPSDEKKSVLHMKFYDKKLKDKAITGFISFFGKRGYDEYDFVNDIFNRDY